MLNHINAMARLTRDPELRHTQSGNAVCSFSIACERDRADKDGKREVDYLDIVAWDKNAEFVSKWFSKGQLVAVSGRLKNREWQDKDGNKRRSAEIVAHVCYFAESKWESAPAQFQEVSVDDGELPF